MPQLPLISELKELPPWVRINEVDGIVEYYMDHTLLSTFRMCEERFMLDFVKNLRPKSQLGTSANAMPWPLRFGILIHDCMEELYKRLMTKHGNSLYGIEGSDGTKIPFSWSAQDLRDWLTFSSDLWKVGNLDSYSNIPAFKTLGGFSGFIAILAGYSEHYAKNYDRNNLKCVALEIGFGKNKEVPVLEDSSLYKFAPFRLYLSGRMDYIFDDGSKLGPLDHKTFSISGKNPIVTYEVQEGMTGYAYAMSHLYKKLKAELELSHPGQTYDRRTNTVWMNFIYTPHEQDINKKFQRIPLYKTEYQLEEWRQRQISTVAKLHQILFEGRKPDWNTQVCTNYWHSTCTYQGVHRLGSDRDMLTILNSQFQVGEAWEPER